MFDYSKFVRVGLLQAIGCMPDYKVILSAASYFDKGVLSEDDLKIIQNAIDRQAVYAKMSDDFKNSISQEQNSESDNDAELNTSEEIQQEASVEENIEEIGVF